MAAADPETNSLVWENVAFNSSPSICFSLKQIISNGLGTASSSRKYQSKILDNLSGKIRCGELCALMGPSGAGKSTLLKFLTSGQNHKGCSGSLFIANRNQSEGKPDFVKAAIINQDEKDHLLLNLTVYESLYYASLMKNPKRTKTWRHHELIEIILDELVLEKIKSSRIDCCSGGEKKRIAIGLELVAEDKPKFLFLDEPTSGLDSYSGFNVVFLLQKLAADHKMAITATIHQPSFEMLTLFQHIYVISKAGQCIYSGSPNYISTTLSNYNFKSSEVANPADSLLRIASSVNRENDDQYTLVGSTDTASERIEMGNMALNSVFLIEGTHAQEQIPQNMEAVHGLTHELDRNRIICEQMTKLQQSTWETVDAHSFRNIELKGICNTRAGFSFKNVWVLLRRSGITSIWRQRKLILIRLVLHAIVGALLTTLYGRDIGLANDCSLLGEDGKILATIQHSAVGQPLPDNIRAETTTSQNVKFQFFSLLFLMFAALMPTVLTFPAEIKIFLNEHRNGWYSSGTYYLAKTIVEIPCQFVFTFCYTYLLYCYSNQIGMEKWYGGFFGFMTWRYSYFLWLTILSCFVAQGVGFLIGIVCVDSFNISVIVSSSTLLFLFLFSGFFVKVIGMSPYAQWITCFSFIRFSFESLLITLYGFGRCRSNYFPDQRASVLYQFDLKDSDLRKEIVCLIAHLILIRVMAYILLRKKADRNFLKFRVGCYKNLALPTFITSKVEALFRKFGTLLSRGIVCVTVFILAQLCIAAAVFLIYRTS